MGKNCVVCLNTFEGLTIVTDSPESTVLIGERGNFGGVTIRCKGSIAIKDRALFAHCLIQDVPIFNQQSTNPKPISIDDNVWLSTQTVVLGGAKIGKDAVISTGCVCAEEVKDGNLVMYGFKRQLDISKLKALCS
jgi:acetyltransferase-like isoleucine patch superfamily enzyme